MPVVVSKRAVDDENQKGGGSPHQTQKPKPPLPSFCSQEWDEHTSSIKIFCGNVKQKQLKQAGKLVPEEGVEPTLTVKRAGL